MTRPRAVVVAIVVLMLAVAAIAVKAFGDAAAIQQQRIDLIRSSCEAQNARHDHTIATLNSEIAAASKHASPARLAEIKASKGGTIQLIQALAPHQDCKRVLTVATH